MVYYKMANAILNSNSSSALVSALSNVSSSKNPFEYSYASKGTLGYSSVPAHARVVSTSQTSNVGFSQNCDFQILKSGLLESAMIKYVVTNSTGANVFVNPNLGNLLLEEIQLISQGKVLQSSKPFLRACLASSAPYQRKKNMEAMMALDTTNVRKTMANGSSLTFYVPLGFSIFDCPANYLDTNFSEKVQVRVRTASANAYADDGASPAVAESLTLTSMELVQVFRMLDSETESKTISANFAEDDLVKVLWSGIEEATQKTLSASTGQTIKHTITTNRCIAKLYIAVEDEADATATDLATQQIGVYKALSNIKISANGQTFVDEDAELIAYCLGIDCGSEDSPNCVSNYFDTGAPAHTKNIYEFQLGLSKGTDKFQGMISAREINDLSVEVTLAGTATAHSHKLLVAMICPALQSTSSASGKISTSLSS